MTVTATVPRLRDKIMACWLGKAIGGTLGMPYEGVRDRLNLTYYDPVPTEMLPNDDLDLQVVYAALLSKMPRPRVDRLVLARAWDHVGMSPDEYGICKRNLELGLTPPTTGSYDNWFAHGMGAAIRTELWACLAAGDPALAAAYAFEDACMDHDGEGIYAAQFLAALQAKAFVEPDPRRLLTAALGHIPADCRIARGVLDTCRWWDELHDHAAVLERIYRDYGHDNFTDVCLNLPMIVLGLLAGAGDFGASICAAVNGGQDTDCTGATLGALMGILAPDSIPQRWLDPIGRDLVLSDCITGIEHPPTLDGFTDQVLSLRAALGPHTPAPVTRQDVSHLALSAELSFAHWPMLPDGPTLPTLPGLWETMRLPGSWAQLPSDAWRGRVAAVRYRLNFASTQTARLLFNSPVPTRVYVDGALALARDAGPMVPAFHRAPLHQWLDRTFTAGTHEIVALLERPFPLGTVQWVLGLSERAPNLRPVDARWLTQPLWGKV